MARFLPVGSPPERLSRKDGHRSLPFYNRTRIDHMKTLVTLPLLLILVLAGRAPAVQQTATNPFAPPDPDPRVPPVASLLGFEIGSRPATHHEVLSAFEAWAEASPRGILLRYGKTHEGRDLLLLVVSSEENIARLDSLREAHARLADPRGIGEAETARLLETTPVFAWMAYTIHGDEISGTDAAVALAHRLLAARDAVTRSILDNVVVLIDPVQNPDGRDRFLAQIRQAQGTVPSSDPQSLQHVGFWPWGRGNHYLFDLNRDYLAASQPESRGRVRTMAAWNPQLVVDAHEMGSDDTYLFSPPREPFNAHFSSTLLGWMETLARDQALALDEHGWPYYTREWADNWYPGYTDAFAALSGAVGMLYEQAGVDGTLIRKTDGSLVTYTDAVRNQLVSSLANLTTAARHRKAILGDFARLRREACEGRRWSTIGAPRPTPEDAATAYVVVRDGSGREEHLARLLEDQGIEVRTTTREITIPSFHDSHGDTVPDRRLPADSLVISLRQPRGSLARALLGFDPRMTDAFVTEERRSIERGDGSRLYDITSWSLSLAFDLDVGWTDEDLVPATRLLGERPEPVGGIEGAEARHGYLLPFPGESAARTLVRLLESELIVRCARRPFTLEGRTWERGTLLVPRVGNPPDLGARLAEIGARGSVTFTAISTGFAEEGPDLGGSWFALLERPRVAILAGPPTSPSDYGALWHLLDHELGLRVSAVPASLAAELDLSKYNVLVVPPSMGSLSFTSLLGDRGKERLESWIEGGGTLIAVGGAASDLASPDSSVSKTRRRRDVLQDLPVYEEERKRRAEATALAIDFEKLWSPGVVATPTASEERAADGEPVAGTTVDTEAAAALDGTKTVAGKKPGDKEELERQDTWERRFSPRGAFLRAHLDLDHWLTTGLSRAVPRGAEGIALEGKAERLPETAHDLPVLVSGSVALVARDPVEVPVRLAPLDRLRLSGLLWPEAAKRLADTAYVTRERRGKGQVILFRENPAFRGFLLGPRRLLVNALLLGSGLGTERTAPF